MARAILTDIEGTTTPIAFVKDVLFPYARARIADYIVAHAGEPAVAEARVEIAAAAGCGVADDATLARTLITWIDEDSKATALKMLQGMLWAEGYAKGELHATVYPDAAQQLRAWHKAGKQLFVYSSGSVQAQKLLFGHSDQGSLLPLFSGYFDTAIGAKRERASYSRIGAAMQIPLAEILFLSDVPAELDAARAAGMQTCWIVRANDITPTAAELHSSVHPIAQDFMHVDC